MWITLLALAHATPSGPMPRFTLIEGCEEAHAIRGDLEITFREIVQSCPPGGPCSVMSDKPLDASEVKVQVDGCEGVQHGHFEPSRWCHGQQVWRFRGEIPPGRDLRLFSDNPATNLGWLNIEGERRDSWTCPAAPPERPMGKAQTRTDEHHLTVLLDPQVLHVEDGVATWEVGKQLPGQLGAPDAVLTAPADTVRAQGMATVHLVQEQIWRTWRTPTGELVCRTERIGTVRMEHDGIAWEGRIEGHPWEQNGRCPKLSEP